MIIEGRAVLVQQDNVDTDMLYPGAYLNIDDPEGMKPYLFEGLDPGLREELDGDVILVVGENFGAGSSREHVVQAMKAWNIRCVLGKSFARIFYRNCINLGLLAIVQPQAAEEIKANDIVRIDTKAGELSAAGRRYSIPQIPDFVLDMVSSGGLVSWASRRMEENTGP